MIRRVLPLGHNGLRLSTRGNSRHPQHERRKRGCVDFQLRKIWFMFQQCHDHGWSRRSSARTRSDVKAYWEIIADNLSKTGWSWGRVSGVDSHGRIFLFKSEELHSNHSIRTLLRTRRSFPIESLSYPSGRNGLSFRRHSSSSNHSRDPCKGLSSPQL